MKVTEQSCLKTGYWSSRSTSMIACVHHSVLDILSILHSAKTRGRAFRDLDGGDGDEVEERERSECDPYHNPPHCPLPLPKSARWNQTYFPSAGSACLQLFLV